MPSSNSIDPSSQSNQTDTSFTIDCEDRWQVYHRLQELDFRCQCAGFKPLQVEVETAAEAVQLWSVVQRVSQPKQRLVDTLKRSWKRPCGTPAL